MTKTIHVNSVDIWTECFGEKQEKGIILISGAMAPATFWPDLFCWSLADLGYFVIRFDNRDMGYSTHFKPCRPEAKTALPYTIDDMIEDVKGIMGYYELKSCVIAGHSLGASIAQLFAIKYPNKTKGLFAISSPILAYGNNQYVETDEAITKEMWEVLMSNKMYQDFERGKDEFLRIWEYLNGGWELDVHMAAEYTKRIYETEIIEPAWNHTKVQEGIPDMFDKLNALELPKHFLHGEVDYLPSNPKNVKMLADSLKHGDFVSLPRAGHLFFNEGIWDIVCDIFKKKILEDERKYY